MALTKISGEVIQSGINIGVVTASTINVGSAVTVHTGGFRVGTSDLHSTGISVTNVDSIGVITARNGVVVSSGNVLIGTGTSTGTTSQPLQVTGGAYVSGNIGIGTTNPTAKLQVIGSTDLNKLNLSGISSSISSTAVRVFVYDTRKDSDGGAWRKRTQNTSWYNETLNTATRGSRRDFPAVAVIVATTTSVTIYDGDDPDMPMWMIFNRGTDTSTTMWWDGNNANTATSIVAINGLLFLTTSNAGSYGADFIGERWIYFYNAQVNSGYRNTGGGIINRNSAVSSRIVIQQFNGYSPSGVCNDVAMTVLPNAPIDAATGLPVPTIAVATNGGVSVIKDDGTVINWLTTVGYIAQVSISKNYEIFAGGGGGIAFYAWYNKTIPTSSSNNSDAIFGTVYSSTSLPRLGSNGNSVVGDENVFSNDTIYFSEYAGASTNNKLIILNQNTSHFGNSLVAYLTSSYNTGWMHGNIQGAWLSDTSTASVTGTGLVTGQASTYDVNTTNGGWTSQSSASNAYNATNGVGGTGCIRLTSSGNSNVWNSLNLGTVTSGAKYSITFSAKIASSAPTSFLISGNQNAVTVYASLSPTVTTSHVTYSFIFTTSATTAWLNVFAGNGSGSALDIDNIDVRLLSEPDRSVNDKGLAVYGTLTKTAVATGSNLVGYSGFSGSNYLQQPYNSALSFGTGDFSVMCWHYHNAGQSEINITRNNGGADGWRLVLGNSNQDVYIVNGNFTTYVAFPGLSLSSTWQHWVFVRRYNFGWIVYRNGVQVATTSILSTFNFAENAPLAVSSGGNTDSIALLRVSASVPSPTQIAKIYNDEKMLFQENSQCTLYGSSDAVTALAYDDTTKLLSVGTSSGRSDFQGLERINNTTTAVTTAISASNGLIAEQ